MAVLKVNGKDVDIPTIDSLDIDEAILFEEQSGVTLEQVELGESVPMKGLKALIHIGVQRALPDASFEEVTKAAGKVKLAAVAESWNQEAAKEQEVPPTQTGSSRNSSGSGLSGGDGSESSSENSEEAASAPPTSGTPASDTSASASEMLVV